MQEPQIKGICKKIDPIIPERKEKEMKNLNEP